MFLSVPSVAERLCAAFAICETLTQSAVFEAIPPPPLPPPNYTPREVLDTLIVDLMSIQAALSPACLSTRAPYNGRAR